MSYLALAREIWTESISFLQMVGGQSGLMTPQAVLAPVELAVKQQPGPALTRNSAMVELFVSQTMLLLSLTPLMAVRWSPNPYHAH